MGQNLGIKFRKRPYPHDFPAFAHDKPAVELNRLRASARSKKKPTSTSRGESTEEMKVESIENVTVKD